MTPKRIPITSSSVCCRGATGLLGEPKRPAVCRDDGRNILRARSPSSPGRDPSVADLRRWLDQPENAGCAMTYGISSSLTWLTRAIAHLMTPLPFRGEIGEYAQRMQCAACLTDHDQLGQGDTVAGDILDPMIASLYRSAPGLGGVLASCEKARGRHEYAHLLNICALLGSLIDPRANRCGRNGRAGPAQDGRSTSARLVRCLLLMPFPAE